jgi:hypothetical protein
MVGIEVSAGHTATPQSGLQPLVTNAAKTWNGIFQKASVDLWGVILATGQRKVVCHWSSRCLLAARKPVAITQLTETVSCMALSGCIIGKQERTCAMTKHVMETVTFKLIDNVRREDFVQAANAMSGWILNQPGFLSRRLSIAEDGTWIEQVEWASMHDATAAAAAIGAAQDNMPFMKCIDGASVQMRHSELEVAVN